MSLVVNIKDIVKNLGKNTRFLQPLFEAISNSLEAKATKINIFLNSASDLFNEHFIKGFVIEDNGEGFTKENIDAFNTLWTDNKRRIGCKGSGRFTWLKIFKSVKIESFISNENAKVTIPFNIDYNGNYEKTNFVNSNNENLTRITFSEIQEEYAKIKEPSNPLSIKKKILDYFLLKFFLMKKNNIRFEIEILNDFNESTTINWCDIPDISNKSFSIRSSMFDLSYSFDLYYIFEKDQQNNKKVYFCSNQRSIKEFEDKKFGLSSPLPENDSFTMFLCSEYFEEKDDDSRNDFEFLSSVKSPNIYVPITLDEIVNAVKKEISTIIKGLYPNIDSLNEKEVKEAIEKAPHLSNYIKENLEIIKSSDSLLLNAKKQFEKDKEVSKKQFDSLLASKGINSEEFTNAVNKISSIAAAELGEYIVYRDTIINALKKSLFDKKTKENVIHNLIIPKNSITTDSDNNKHLLSNLWLIDDKFMTYSYVYSDKTFSKISNDLTNDKYTELGRLNRPDTAIIFNKKDGRKDAIVIEYKGPNADSDEKNKSITELPNNVNILRNSVNNIGVVWSYIFATFDDKFESTLINQDYLPLFSIGEEGKTYYRFLKNVNTHIYVMDYNALTENAESRNKTFMDLLKSF